MSLMLSGKRSFKDTHIITPDANDKDAWIILSFFLKRLEMNLIWLIVLLKSLKEKAYDHHLIICFILIFLELLLRI